MNRKVLYSGLTCLALAEGIASSLASQKGYSVPLTGSLCFYGLPIMTGACTFLNESNLLKNHAPNLKTMLDFFTSSGAAILAGGLSLTLEKIGYYSTGYFS